MTDPANPPPAPEPASDPWPVPEVDDLDLAASALLDEAGSGSDQSTSDQGVRADGSPRGSTAVEARAAELRSVVEALAEPMDQPDTSIRDAQLHRALASGRLTDDPADALGAGGGGSGRGGARARRWLAVAAAAVALLLVGGLAVAHLASSHSPGAQTASVAGSAAATTTSPAAQPDAALPQAGTQSSASLAQLPDLGSFATADALVARVGRHQANGRFSGLFGPTSTVAGATSQPSAGVDRTDDGSTCEATVRAGRHDLGPLDQVARASVAGQAVGVLLFAAGPAPADVARVVAVRPADCQVVVDRTA